MGKRCQRFLQKRNTKCWKDGVGPVGGGVVCDVVCAFHIVIWWLYISHYDILGNGVGGVVFTLVEGS